MNLNIKRVKRIENETGLFCFDDCIATIANFFDSEYRLMYAGGIKVFKNDNPDEIMMTHYEIKFKKRLVCLEKYHGIVKNNLMCKSKEEWIEQIKFIINNNKPTLVYLDQFWCPWDLGFQKFSTEIGHSFFIKECRENSFICLDPYFEKDNIELPFDYFFKGKKGVLYFEKNKDINLDKQELFTILHDGFLNLKNSDLYIVLRQLVEEINEKNNYFIDVVDDNKLWSSPLMVFMLLINQCLCYYSEFTSCIATKLSLNGLEQISKKIWNLAIQWKQVRKLLVKMYFLRKENILLKRRLIDKMTEVIKSFENLVDLILCQNYLLYRVESERHVDKKLFKQKQLKLSLLKLFNNKAFITTEAIEKGNFYADFTSIGHAYVVNKKISDTIIMDNVEFNLINVNSEFFDNVECSGQFIEVNSQGFSRLSIVGAAEFGGASDIIHLEYSDGSIRELEIQLTDYIFKPQFGEKIIWEGKGVCLRNRNCEFMDETLYLYKKQYCICNEKILRIKLPINPSMHIFAMTLHNVNEK